MYIYIYIYIYTYILPSHSDLLGFEYIDHIGFRCICLSLYIYVRIR